MILILLPIEYQKCEIYKINTFKICMSVSNIIISKVLCMRGLVTFEKYLKISLTGCWLAKQWPQILSK